MRVLEVGCGTGHWLAVMRQLGAHVTGLDASSGMLARARERLPDVEFVHGTAEHLPWPHAHFDLVLTNNALHHFPAQAELIAEAHRVLIDTGGRLAVIGLESDLSLFSTFGVRA